MIFSRYIGIDYSGAQTPTSNLTGLRVTMAEDDGSPVEVLPPHPRQSPRKYWTRKGVAEWLVERLAEDAPTLVGIDHGFSFPLRYFEASPRTRLAGFLDDFQHHWPTDQDTSMSISSATARATARRARATPLAAADRGARRRREIRVSFRRAGIGGEIHPCRHSLAALHPPAAGARVHFWPFDGWDIPAGRSAIAEVYPALWNATFANEGRTGDQHDAFSIAAWLSRADHDGSLAAF